MKRIGFLLILSFLFSLSLATFATAGEKKSTCIDVETASAKQLTALKGVGDKIAKAIIDFRKKKRTAATKAKKKTWNFGNWATLYQVSGVSEKICKDNKDRLCFSGKLQKTCPKPTSKKRGAAKGAMKAKK